MMPVTHDEALVVRTVRVLHMTTERLGGTPLVGA